MDPQVTPPQFPKRPEPASVPPRAPQQPTASSPYQSQTTPTTQPISPSPRPQLEPSPQPQPTTPSTPPPAAIMAQATAHDRKRSILHGVRGFLSTVVFIVTVVVAAMLINAFVFQSYYVDGTSMTPTLQNEDRLIIDKTGKTGALIQGKQYLPKRGDIVVLDSSILDQYGHEEQLIKRVIGLPGDTVTINDGVVHIRNSEFPEGFAVDQKLGLELGNTYTDTPIEVTIPEGSIYVLGDNRGPNGSFDSRSFGLVDSKNVQGRLAIRIFPFNTSRFF